jgi:hypothetical protein
LNLLKVGREDQVVIFEELYDFHCVQSLLPQQILIKVCHFVSIHCAAVVKEKVFEKFAVLLNDKLSGLQVGILNLVVCVDFNFVCLFDELTPKTFFL